MIDLLITQGPSNTFTRDASNSLDAGYTYEFLATDTEVPMIFQPTIDHELLGEHTFTLTTNLRDYPAMDEIMLKTTIFKLTITSVC